MPKSILSSVNIFYFRLHFSCSSSDCDSTSLPADPSGDPSDQVVPGGGQVISSKHSILTIIMMIMSTILIVIVTQWPKSVDESDFVGKARASCFCDQNM